MPLPIRGRVLLFDYGEVISMSPAEEDRAAIERVAAVAPADLWRAYQADRDRLDAGLVSTTDYWTAIGRACGADWDLPTIQLLWTLDVRSWTTPEPEVVRILGELAEGGTRLAMLSNAAADYGGLLRFSPVGMLFERVFVSGELLLLKPDEAIYRHAADELGVAPAEVVFVDNREANVRGAEAIGMTGHVFTGAAALQAFLEPLTAA